MSIKTSRSGAIRSAAQEWVRRASLEELLDVLPASVVSQGMALEPPASAVEEVPPQPAPRRAGGRVIRKVRHRVKHKQSAIIRERLGKIAAGTPEYKRAQRDLGRELELTLRQIGGAMGQFRNPRHPPFPGPGRRRKTASVPVVPASAVSVMA